MPVAGSPDDARSAAPPLFRGVGCALVTLFTEDGAPDVDATAAHALRLVHRGVTAILVAGTTGEAARLDGVARSALVTAIRGAVPADVPVLAGTGAATVTAAEGFTRDAVAAGADAVLAFPPPDGRDVPGYYRAVASAGAGRPLLAYHYPTVLPPGIPVDDLVRLPVVGVKDSSGDAERLLETLEVFAGSVYTGSAVLLHLAGSIGAAGAILALANVLPEECAEAWHGDADAQRRVYRVHREVVHDSPRAVKRMVGSGLAGSGASPRRR